jgi:hypothetical protein
MQFLMSRFADRDGAREPVRVLDPIQLLLDALPQHWIVAGGGSLLPLSHRRPFA